jgi:hypothetical protein
MSVAQTSRIIHTCVVAPTTVFEVFQDLKISCQMLRDTRELCKIFLRDAGSNYVQIF